MTRIHAWWWGRVPSRCRSLCFNSPLVMLHVSVKLMQPHSSQEEWGGWRKNKYASSTTSVFSFPCQEYVWGTGSLNLPPKLSLHHCWRTDGRGLVAVELSTAAARRHLMVDLLFCWNTSFFAASAIFCWACDPRDRRVALPPKKMFNACTSIFHYVTVICAMLIGWSHSWISGQNFKHTSKNITPLGSHGVKL